MSAHHHLSCFWEVNILPCCQLVALTSALPLCPYQLPALVIKWKASRTQSCGTHLLGQGREGMVQKEWGQSAETLVPFWMHSSPSLMASLSLSLTRIWKLSIRGTSLLSSALNYSLGLTSKGISLESRICKSNNSTEAPSNITPSQHSSSHSHLLIFGRNHTAHLLISPHPLKSHLVMMPWKLEKIPLTTRSLSDLLLLQLWLSANANWKYCSPSGVNITPPPEKQSYGEYLEGFNGEEACRLIP